MVGKFLKDWMLLIAMITGAMLNKFTPYVSFIIPYLIFSMLLISFARLSPRDIKFNKLHFILLAIQLGGGIAVYWILQFLDVTVAQGAMMCILASTATSSVVIAGMLDGDMAFLTTYTLLSSMGLALTASLFFPVIMTGQEMSFGNMFIFIGRQIGTMLVLPLLISWSIQLFLPRMNTVILKLGKLSFYFWAVALTIVMGNTVRFLIEQENPQYGLEVILAVCAGVICFTQFAIGRSLGRKLNDDPVSAGQGLGQKNTVLAIWMAQSYLNPVSSVAPAAYVVWQNLINSYQIWHKERFGRAHGK